MIYVTHALDEVSQLADSLVLIEAGRVVGYGALSEIAARADLPLAQRDDAGGLLRAVWRSMTPPGGSLAWKGAAPASGCRYWTRRRRPRAASASRPAR